MTIKVLVNGAGGRMGQEACKAIAATDQLILVGEAHRHDDLAQKIKQSHAEVVVDLTTPESVFANAQIILEAGAHPVIGTTGLTTTQIQILQQRSAALNRGGIIAPNFSIGAVLMMKYAQDAARYFPKVEIIEMHHDQKKDAPSGTALKTAAMIKENLKSGTHQNIPIHSVRLSGLVAHQLVLFGGQGETLIIRHDSIHREAFMPGLCLACKRVKELDSLVYGLEHLV